jgi:hypothetical protein
MTHPISIQNSLQNQYLGIEEQDLLRPLDCKTLETVEKSDHQSPKLIQGVISVPEGAETADETVMQRMPNTRPQAAPPVAKEIREDTILQYSDSALHNPADQTVHQKITPISHQEPDETVYQFNPPQIQQSQALAMVQDSNVQMPSVSPTNIAQTVVMGSGSLTSRFSNLTGQFLHSARQMFDPSQWQARLRPQQLPSLKPSGKAQNNQPTPGETTTETQISLEQYQKALRELDDCRLSYAKELARNGKFRDAIAMARKVTATSRCFKDAQTLIRTWKQF